MKHLKAYHELNEGGINFPFPGYPKDTKISASVYISLLEQLENNVTFKNLYNTDFYGWSCIIDGSEWKEFEDSGHYPSLPEDDYKDYALKYEMILEKNPKQGLFDQFTLSVADHRPDLEKGKPISWYLETFGVSRDLSIAMKMLADKSTGGFDIGFETL